MVRTFQVDDIQFTPQEFIVGYVTAVDPVAPYATSWQTYNFNDDLSGFNDTEDGLLSGDYTINYNTAYPINGQLPIVGDICLFRPRGQYNLSQVWEFITIGTGSTPTTDLGLTSIQCTGGIMVAIFSDGCTKT